MREREHKNSGVYVRITPQENKMLRELREKYSTNISQLVRNSIRHEYNQRTGK